MPGQRSPLRDDPAFLVDCASAMKKRDICAKWECSSGIVVNVRREHGGPVDEARSRKTAAEQAIAHDRQKLEYVDDKSDPEKGDSYTRLADTAWGEDDWREFLRLKGTDPDSVTFSFGVTSNPHGGYWNKLLNVRPKTGVAAAEHYPLAQLYAEAARSNKNRTSAGSRKNQTSDRSTVIVVADWQIGKTGRRGGTPELLARLEDARNKVAIELAERQPDSILVLDGGDGIEGFDSGGDPSFTNDLSLPDQIDAYTTELFKFIRLAHTFSEDVQVGAVPSNHSSWRRGKQNLGTPADDFGLLAHRQVQKVAAAAGITAEWHFPDVYDESLCVDFAGTPIGLVHGNQFGPGKAIDWWQGQAFGDQAITRADVLVSAHYHSFGAGVAGINPLTKRERMWLGAPTLDSGSDWYRNIRGRDSLPGTLIFDVTPDGFDLGSLKVL